MIRAVIFDMYETLVTLLTGPRCFSGEMAALAGADVETFRAAWRATEDARMTGLPLEKALRRTMEAAGCWEEEAYERILRQRRASREIRPEALHPEILPLLIALRERGLRIGLVTNCQSDEAAEIRRSLLWPHFDAPVLSCEVGLMKPDTAIFERCTRALGVEAKECLYVGDGGSCELTAARRLGMRAVQAAWHLPAEAPRAAFERCTRALGVEAKECLYVGDGGSCELTAARRLGMRAVQAAWHLPAEAPRAACPQAETPLAVLSHLG